jgi:nicotinate-nucleotide adenylyltransferase
VSPRIGLFGGTFDPPHVGHLAVARAVREQLALDTVLLEVAHQPWQKAGNAITPSEVRFEMVTALVEGEPGIQADNREILRGGNTFTIDTVRQIKDEMPDAEIFLVIGEDSAHQFHTWREHETLARLSTLVVVNRPDHDTATPAGVANMVRVVMPDVPVSSTKVRAAVAAGEDIAGFTSAEVARIVSAHNLYRSAQ